MSSVAPRVAYAPQLNTWQIECAKWLGFVAMLADHTNKALFAGELVGWSEFGRLTFPLFAYALGSGLRSHADMGSVEKRLWMWALASQVPFWLLWGRSDLNVLFALAGGVTFVQACARRDYLLCAVLAIGSTWVEFGWFGLGMVVASIYVARSQSLEVTCGWVASLALLGLSNGNDYALLSVPVLYLVQFVQLRVPRMRGVFYPLYPLHLLVLAAIVAL